VNFRILGKTKERVSILGFGAMRLPTKGSDAEVDEPRAVEMIRHAIDRGVNYVDSAYVYHGGHSEEVVGRALRDGYRRKVFVATKLPVWSVQKIEDAERLFNEQLARLQTDCIDMYLLHCLMKESWPRMRDLGVLKWAEKKREEGRIKHIGFSFHDAYEVFTGIVDGYDWSFCQIQYNLMNEGVQAGTRGLEYAARKGLGVIVMEPLFGGALANPPEAIRAIWNSAGRALRPADAALRWVWDKPGVSLVLSGMTTPDQVKENLETAGRAGKPWLDDDERRVIARVQEAYGGLSPVPCTKCGYCMPCPSGVDIPLNFELYNSAAVYKGNTASLSRNLFYAMPEAQRSTACQECGTCEEKCPQRIPIMEKLKSVGKHFA
jgi:hypothetical protein